jgi:hypothetical protein
VDPFPSRDKKSVARLAKIARDRQANIPCDLDALKSALWLETAEIRVLIHSLAYHICTSQTGKSGPGGKFGEGQCHVASRCYGNDRTSTPNNLQTVSKLWSTIAS